MSGAAEARRGDGESSHRGGADRSGRGPTDHRIERDQPQRRPGGEASEEWPKRSLHDAGEDSDLEAAEDQKVNEPSRDERVLQVGRDALADAEHDSQKHGCVRRRHCLVQRGRVVRAQPGWKAGQTGSGADHVKAGGLDLQVDLPLREVCAAVKRRQVARKDQLSHRLDLVTEGGLGGAAPADHEVADAADLGRTDQDACRLDQDLTATG